MELSRAELEDAILEFMAVVYDCYKNTNYANDRHSYAKDLTVAMGWIVELRGGADVSKVVESILSIETDRTLIDYRRGGEWGLSEADALGTLRALVAS